jgi:hypothetical protein
MSKQHIKERVTTPTTDNTSTVVTTSYTEKLSSVKTETEKKILTNTDTFLGDILSCLDVIKKHETRQLVIEISTDKFYQPKLIIKTWTTSKEYHGK